MNYTIKLKSLKAISKLLKKRGIDLLNVKIGKVLELEKKGGLMRFVIEKIAENEISFAFYGMMNGDLMRDPEVTFIIKEVMRFDSKKGLVKEVYLTPSSFQNDYVGIYQRLIKIEDNIIYSNKRGIKNVIPVVRDMDNNISMRTEQF